MKKFIFSVMFVMACAMTMTSCGNASKTEETDADTTIVDTVVVDSIANDSTVVTDSLVCND